MIVRPNHRDVSPADKANFVKAVLALKNDVDSVLRPGKQKRLWEKWKGKHPASAPYLPKSGSTDYDLNAKLVFNASNKPAPWSQTYVVADTLEPADLGYTYQS